jgi:hypothetical protein
MYDEPMVDVDIPLSGNKLSRRVSMRNQKNKDNLQFTEFNEIPGPV